MPQRIEDYALIGDCRTAALVGRDGSIDWLCWPRFDSDACFAALLGTPKHGRWLIAPRDAPKGVVRRYRPNTLILETRFATAAGAVTVTDFMPMSGEDSRIVRVVSGERGLVPMRLEFVLRFGYGAIVPWVTRLDDGALRAIAGPDMALLYSPVPTRGEDFTTVADFEIGAGETLSFVLAYASSHRDAPARIDPEEALAETERFWTGWIKKCRPAGEWSEAVARSLITLKALSYSPTGGIVAAATTSLPERIGGERNWDYRYCWLRDATLTLLALMNAGYFDEARAWRGWLHRAVAGSPDQLQIMYGVGGERRLIEWEVPWLPGFEGSQPVRIGNAAHQQLQIDVYGEVMDVFYQARRGGLAGGESSWELQREILVHLEQHWREPDHGMWEVRTAPLQFTYSKVMAWAAFDRAIKSAEEFNLAGPLDRWREIRDEIHANVCRDGFDPGLGTFVQSYGSKELDANLLLLPAVGFLPPHDPRIQATVDAIAKYLMSGEVVFRYDSRTAPDGLPPREGAFLACSFWLVDAFVMLGHRAKARHLFERLLALRNDVGLLSEEYDPNLDRAVGNFPQAFSHIALINSAFNLARADNPAKQRSDQEFVTGTK